MLVSPLRRDPRPVVDAAAQAWPPKPLAHAIVRLGRPHDDEAACEQDDLRREIYPEQQGDERRERREQWIRGGAPHE